MSEIGINPAVSSLVDGGSVAATKNSQLGQDDFLRLLVAQMENQDPTKPMDNFQFLSQIAQFGMVDGIQNLESSFGSVAESVTQSQLLQASSLIGRDVLAPGNISTLTSGEGVAGLVDTDGAVENLVVEIRSGTGLLVKTLNLGSTNGGAIGFEWDGNEASGEPAADGNYFVHARGLINGESRDLPLQTLGRVDSIMVDQLARVSVNLTNGETLDLAAVRQIQ